MSKQRGLNPTLKELSILVGDWDMELSNAEFLPSPKAKVHGPVSFKWAEDGAYLVAYQGATKAPWARWLIGRDQATGQYNVFYFDSRGVSRIYDMEFKKGIWKMWRNAPDLPQSFKGVFKGRNTIIAEWKTAKDGKHLKHDFDMKYTRITASAKKTRS